MTVQSFLKSSLCGTAVAVVCVAAGCHNASHPDQRSAVYNAFSQNDLSSVQVVQDQDKGVMTLNGIVGSDAQKQKAETLAKQAAPDYTIADQIKVNATGIMSMADPNAKPPQVVTMPHAAAHHHKHSAGKHKKEVAENQ